MNHPLSKLYDPSKVTNSVRFHYLYYLSKAYFKRFIMELEAAKKVGEGYGTVVYYVRKAIETMQTVKTVSPSLTQFQKNLAPEYVQRAEAEISAMKQYGEEIEKKNNQVYCEVVPTDMKMAARPLAA